MCFLKVKNDFYRQVINAKLNALIDGNHDIPIALIQVTHPIDGYLPFGAYRDENGVLHYKPDKINFFVEGGKHIKNLKGVHIATFTEHPCLRKRVKKYAYAHKKYT